MNFFNANDAINAFPLMISLNNIFFFLSYFIVRIEYIIEKYVSIGFYIIGRASIQQYVIGSQVFGESKVIHGFFSCAGSLTLTFVQGQL